MTMTNASLRRLTLAAVIGSLAILALSAPPALAAKRPPRPDEGLTYPKLNPIKTPEVVRQTLPNGLRLILVEDRALPKIEVRAVIRGGRLTEPAGKAGLTELFGEVLRTGGVQSTPGDAVDEFLDRRGAAIESGVDVDSVDVYARMLVEHRDEVLPLFAEFLLKPTFAQEKVDLAKKQLRSAISRRNDNVEGIANREFRKLLLGASYPDARQFEYEDIDGLTRDDLVAYHTRVFRPDQAIVAAWGDFAADEMKSKLAELLGGWPVQGAPPRYERPSPPEPSFSVNYIEKQDVAQTYFQIGHLALRYDDPDFAAVQVMGRILGGGFSSRIFVSVRTEKGLAYRAGSQLNAGFDWPGWFVVTTSTKPSTTAVALKTVLEELRKIREAPVADDELQRAKEGYLNSYAFDFASQNRIVRRLVTYEFYGYPEDFNTRLRDAIEKVTKEDVLRAAKKHLRPDVLTILAIGKAAEFDEPLSTFGDVRTIDITIPAPKTADAPAPTPKTLARGRELLLAAARARGEQRLARLEDLTIEGSVGQKTPMGMMDMKIKTVFAPPDRQHMEITTPMGVMVMVQNGAAGWMSMAGKTRPIPGAQAADTRRGLYTSLGCLGLLKQVLAGQIEGQALGARTFEGRAAEAVLVRIEEQPVTVFLSPDGNTVLGTSGVQQTQEGPTEMTTVYSDWTDFDGLSLPRTTVTKAGDETRGTSVLESVKLNAGFDEAIFERSEAAAGAN